MTASCSPDQLAPGGVTELGRLRRRLDDVREQHRGEHAVQLRVLPGAVARDFGDESPTSAISSSVLPVNGE